MNKTPIRQPDEEDPHRFHPSPKAPSNGAMEITETVGIIALLVFLVTLISNCPANG